MNYSIRKLTVNELPEVIQIVRKSLEEDFPMYEKRVQQAYSKIFDRKFFRKLAVKPENTILGAFIKNKLIGFLAVKGDWGGVAFIEWFIVKKEFRGQGVGKALLKACESWALQNKYHCLYLFTESNKNIEFYKKRGFSYVGLYRNIWFGANEHTLQKILRDKPFEEVFKKYPL